MSDLAIKLFGRTILPLAPDQQEDVSCASKYESCSRTPATPESEDSYVNTNIATAAAAASTPTTTTTTSSLHDNKSQREQEEQEVNREPSGEENTNSKQEDDQTIENSKDPASSNTSENPNTPSVERETSSMQNRSTNEEQSDQTSISEEKTLKKPDKILPCPRCDSMDTKFCYYNNYNVNQPRHFCKNCQRYWTAGGTMRNVPVGAGRRKNKSSSASHYRQLIVSEALRTGQVHAMNGVHNPSLGNNGTVLTFCSDSPLCESVASVLQLSEKPQNNVRNVYHRPEYGILVPCGRTADTGDDCFTRTFATASKSSEKGGNGSSGEAVNNKNYQSFLPQVPCFPGPPWPYPWNSAVHPPTFCPSGFPVSFYPAPTYWGCAVPSPWNVPPCISPTSPSLNHSAQSSSPTSPLGKRSRDGKILNPVHSKEPSTSREGTKSENGVVVPKTLRIEDPDEAAKSSIWATLGISKSEKSDSLNGGGLFKGFQSKDQDRSYMAGTSPVLQANPAAFSRSLNFQESSY